MSYNETIQTPIQTPQTPQTPQNPPPTITNNIQKAANLAVSAGVYATAEGINTLAKYFGIDPNKSAEQTVSEVSEKLTELNKALQTPEGQKLKKEASMLLKDAVETVKPSAIEAEKIIVEGATRVAKNGVSAATDVLAAFPPVLAALEASNAIASASRVAKTGFDLVSTGMDAGKDLKKHEPQAMSIYNGVTQLLETMSEETNKLVSDGIDIVKNANNEYGQRVANMKPLEQQTKKNVLTGGGSALTSYQKEAKMIGGRILKSHAEFLYPLFHKTLKYNRRHHSKHQHQTKTKTTKTKTTKAKTTKTKSNRSNQGSSSSSSLRNNK